MGFDKMKNLSEAQSISFTHPDDGLKATPPPSWKFEKGTYSKILPPQPAKKFRAVFAKILAKNAKFGRKITKFEGFFLIFYFSNRFVFIR